MYQKQWDFLTGKFHTGALSHAYLLSGRDREGKIFFAREFIKYLNCLEKSAADGVSEPRLRREASCGGRCANCMMVDKGSFPDFHVVTSSQSATSMKNDADSMEIDVMQARSAQNFLSYKSYYGGFKSVIIEDTERMNLEAQNCFLKTLEEPKGKTVIFLLAGSKDLLLPTITSRCQEISFFPAKPHELSPSEQALLAGFLRAGRHQLAEKFSYAKNADLSGSNFETLLNALQKHARQSLLAELQSGASNSAAKGLSNHKMKKLLELAGNIHYQWLTGNINTKLALELLLMEA